MTEKSVQIVLLLNVFVCLTRAALETNPVPQKNSLEEASFSSRTSSSSKEENSVRVSYLDNEVLDNFDYRYPDGSYEFRYELADGQARYERGYFVTVNKRKSLVVLGYYSYRSPDGQYITVFYNADQYGYRQNQAVTRDTLPNLPRSIEVPHVQEVPAEEVEATTANAHSNPVTSPTQHNRI